MEFGVKTVKIRPVDIYDIIVNGELTGTVKECCPLYNDKAIDTKLIPDEELIQRVDKIRHLLNAELIKHNHNKDDEENYVAYEKSAISNRQQSCAENALRAIHQNSVSKALHEMTDMIQDDYEKFPDCRKQGIHTDFRYLNINEVRYFMLLCDVFLYKFDKEMEKSYE